MEAMDTAENIFLPRETDTDGDLHSTVMSRYRNSSAPEHRHLCAVVSAMAGVIKEQGLPASPTAYFAATMSALERQFNDSQGTMAKDDDVITALCTFLAMVLPELSAAVLKSKGAVALLLLQKVAGSESASAGALKHALTCITPLFLAADKSEWLRIGPYFNTLVKHCFDNRPKVRKRAHECTADALKGLQGTHSHSMASEAIVTVFEKLILSVGQSNGEDSRSGKEGSKVALQILYLLNGLRLILPLMTGKSIGKVLAFFDKLLQLRQAFLSRQILNIMQPICSDSRADLPYGALSDLLEMLANMISEEKRAGDESMVTARVLTSGFERLCSIDPRSSALKLPTVFIALSGMLACEQEEAVYAAGDSLRSLIENCIDNAMIEQGKASAQLRGKTVNVGPTPIERICITACSLLGYQYSSTWDVCLKVIAALFNKLGDISYHLMSDSVQALAELEGLSDENLPCRRQLHRTVGAAVSAMGPENFLKLLPLNFDDDNLSNNRAWLLPILRQNTVGAQLKYFAEQLIPAIQKLQDKIKKLSEEGKPNTAKKLESLTLGVWSLFPAFCNYPSDTARSFARVAKPIGSVISEEPELRGIICHGLQMLIRQNKAVCGFSTSGKANDGIFSEGSLINKETEEKAKLLYTEKNAKTNISAIASFSRNFLPLLFNIFIAATPEKRGVLLDTIKDFASISDKKVVKDFFVSIMQKLLKATKEAAEVERVKGVDPMDLTGPKQEESASSRRCIFMELALSLLHGLDQESVGVLFTAIRPTLQDVDGSVQKKGYKVLSGLCKESEGFLARKIDDILELMLISMPTCHFSAKRHRLNCLQPVIIHIFNSELQKGENILSSFIGELILATKESNVKTRNAAYEILVQVGHSLKSADPVGTNGRLLQFFTMIVACLAGTTSHMKSAAITALARLLYEFTDLCHTITDLLPSALILLHTKSREVIKSVLGFAKVVVTRQPVEHLQEHLKSLVEGLLLWSDDSKNHFKAKVRVILEILVRRCGLQAVSAVMPEQHAKLLTHIRKMKERKEKKENDETKTVKSFATSARQSNWHHSQFFSDVDTEEGSDEDMDKSIASLSRKSKTTARSNRKLRKSNKMLPEDIDNEDEPLDLLDTQKTRSVLSVNKLKRKEYDDDELEVDMDGRIIVPDENAPKKKSFQNKDDVDEDMDRRSSRSGKSSSKMSVSSKMNVAKGQMNKKRKTEKGWSYTGNEYANKKGTGKGDVKRQGKLDPYAYWPLDPKMMNRREGKKASARKGLASVIQATKKMSGMTVSEALNMKQKKTKNKQKVHKGKGRKR